MARWNRYIYSVWALACAETIVFVLSGSSPFTTVRMTYEMCANKNALVLSHIWIKVSLPLEDFTATDYKTAAKIKLMSPNFDFSQSARFTDEIALKLQRANETTSSNRAWGHQNIDYFGRFISTCNVDAEWILKDLKAGRRWAAAQIWLFFMLLYNQTATCLHRRDARLGARLHENQCICSAWRPSDAETTIFV